VGIKPFLKWAGGKRWLVENELVQVPEYRGRFIEPFLGGGAVFFYHQPDSAILSDLNSRLIEAYTAIKFHWKIVYDLLREKHGLHCKDFYYNERSITYTTMCERAAQFIYLNRACWNGLYRENLKGEFNVPIGSKTNIIFESDDFGTVAKCLQSATLESCDFEATIDLAVEGDFLFVDPPYTTAHNFNGFVKYNQKMFSWQDQVRLKDAISRAVGRGACVLLTNAFHHSIVELYKELGEQSIVDRYSVISGKNKGRAATQEICIAFNYEGALI